MTDDNQINDDHPAKVTAKAPEDGAFPELKTLTYKEMYNVVGKFLQKAIPIKGAKLTIVKGLSNRVSSPKTPFVVLQVVEEKRLSSSETRYTDQHKILWRRSMVTMSMLFMGGGKISALEIGNAFEARFNDSWASEQFEKLGDILFPLYSDDVKIEPDFINAEGQYNDACSVMSYFEYHPEFGVCEASAKELVMDVNLTDKNQGAE